MQDQEDKYTKEYKFNKGFRDYVDKYSKLNKVSVEEALQHGFIKAMYLCYRRLNGGKENA